MARLRTLRLTPEENFPHIQRTCALLQLHLQTHGRTARLQRSEGPRDYFDVLFLTRRDAKDARRNCKMPDMNFAWAPGNISDNPVTGRAKVSFKPPRRDHGDYNTSLSLPLPCNNPYPNKWLVPKQEPSTSSERQQSPEPVYCCRPGNVQIAAANPETPLEERFWPPFPIYPAPL